MNFLAPVDALNHDLRVSQSRRLVAERSGVSDCHWVLAVLYREDLSPSRPQHGAENLAWLRRMAVSLLKNDTTCKRSLRSKSANALGDHEFLLQLLSQVSREKEDT